MRILILAIILFFHFWGVLHAQVEQGTIPIGGGILATNTTAGDYRSSFFNATPVAGYFFTDDLGLTVGVGGSSQRIKVSNFPVSGSSVENRQSQFTLFSTLRHFFYLGDLRLFGQLDANYRSIGNDNVSAPLDALQYFRSKAGIGAQSFLGYNVALEGNLRYEYFSYASYSPGTGGERSEFANGPLELVLDIRPYLLDRGGSPGYLADQYLDQGTFTLGGTTGFSNNFQDELSLWLAPRFGYFLFPNFLGALEGNISYTDDRNNNPVNWGGGSFLRYYGRVTDGLQVVPNIGFYYRETSFRQQLLNERSSANEFRIAPGLGLHIFIAEEIGLFANGTLAFVTRPKAGNTLVDPENLTTLAFQLSIEYYLSPY